MSEAAESPPAISQAENPPVLHPNPVVQTMDIISQPERAKKDRAKEEIAPPKIAEATSVVPETVYVNPTPISEPKFLVSFQNDSREEYAVFDPEGKRLFVVPAERIRDVELKAGYYHIAQKGEQVKIIRIQKEDSIVFGTKVKTLGTIRFGNDTKQPVIIYDSKGKRQAFISAGYINTLQLPDGIYSFEIGTLRDTFKMKSGVKSYLMFELHNKEIYYNRKFGTLDLPLTH